MNNNRMILGFSGFSGSGKTTLIERLIPEFKKQKLNIAVIKHDAHDFEIDREGKDTWRYKEAGADRVYISSPKKSAKFSRCSYSLEEMISDCDNADIIFVEGYKYAAIPRIGVASADTKYELPEEAGVYEAIITDDLDSEFAKGISERAETALFDRNNSEKIASWICDHFNIKNKDNNDKNSDINNKKISSELTHFDPEGNARMVTVADKDITRRTATAGAKVLVNKDTFSLIKNGRIKKGDVLTVAQIAGIMGSKRTPDLIPMCHPIIIDGADLNLKLNEEELAVEIEAKVTCTGRTGVEMEAITAVSVAAMTVYDMCKAVQRDIVLTDIRLLSKTGGIHGDYVAIDKNKSEK